MYRHLMVPLDDSQLSNDAVHQAVQLAQALGAKVTFFHAQSDYGASSIGALERVMSPVPVPLPAWLGTIEFSVHVVPPSVEMKIGAFAPPIGSGVNAEIAI